MNTIEIRTNMEKMMNLVRVRVRVSDRRIISSPRSRLL